jgi:hypothetical protein
LSAGGELTYYLVPNGGSLPPGLELSSSGRITGFTEPIFSIVQSARLTGTFDTAAFDVVPLDKPEAQSNGFDTFLYDTTTYDYNEPSLVPRRLSKFYTFLVAVSDGVNEVRRPFRIWVVTEEFLQADNSLIQVDTNLFRADNSANRVPFWITPSNLGRVRANNYVTLILDVYDPPSLPGTIIYQLLTTNPDGSPSRLPDGLVLDTFTGEIAGKIGYQAAVTRNYNFTLRAVNYPLSLGNIEYEFTGDWNINTEYRENETVDFAGIPYIALQFNKGKVPSISPEFWQPGVTTSDRTFNLDIIGEIESIIEWVTPSDLGTIKPNQPSSLNVIAKNLLAPQSINYELVSGEIPPGLNFIATGLLTGKVKQFADSNGPGLTRFFSTVDGEQVFTTTFDREETVFDKIYRFTIRARDNSRIAQFDRKFFVRVINEKEKTFANIQLVALQSKEKRLSWFNFITDSTIFKSDEIYRYGDPNFGVQTDIKVLLFAGIESIEAVNYVQAMSRNHYNKRILFGDVKTAEARDPLTQETVYEIIYVDIVDPLEKNGKSISDTVNLKDSINSPVLVSYDAIKVDSDIPFVSDSDHQRIFPNSFKNMRKRIKSVGERDREYLPLWMRSIQEGRKFEPGFVKALPICYAKPGFSDTIKKRIDQSGFDFKTIDFVADRYLIDIIDNEISDKYLAFPQSGEKLP